MTFLSMRKISIMFFTASLIFCLTSLPAAAGADNAIKEADSVAGKFPVKQ